MAEPTPFHTSADGRVRLYGHEWHGTRRHAGHVVRCLLRMHRRAQWNHLGDDYEEFCSCGAQAAGSATGRLITSAGHRSAERSTTLSAARAPVVGMPGRALMPGSSARGAVEVERRSGANPLIESWTH
jgi:hypothetical protein